MALSSLPGQNGQGREVSAWMGATRGAKAWGRVARSVLTTTHRPVRGSSRSWFIRRRAALLWDRLLSVRTLVATSIPLFRIQLVFRRCVRRRPGRRAWSTAEWRSRDTNVAIPGPQYVARGPGPTAVAEDARIPVDDHPRPGAGRRPTSPGAPAYDIVLLAHVLSALVGLGAVAVAGGYALALCRSGPESEAVRRYYRPGSTGPAASCSWCRCSAWC